MDDVILVEDEGQVGRKGSDVVDRDGQQRLNFSGKVVVCLQKPLGIRPDSRIDLLLASDEVGQKASRVVVGHVKRESQATGIRERAIQSLMSVVLL